MATLNSLKTKEFLKKGEVVFYSNSEDMAHAFKSKLTGRFCFSFNGKVLFGYKGLPQFIKNIERYLAKTGLTIVDSDSE